jgi:hypothetical protein
MKQIALAGVGGNLPDNGSILFDCGVISLSYGIREKIRREAPGVRVFKVQVILTPDTTPSAKKEGEECGILNQS